MITGELLSAFRSDYNKYLKNFISDDYKDDIDVLRIRIHNEKVVENILVLSDSLELSENEKHTAEIVALFHDIGRLCILLQNHDEGKIHDHTEISIEYLRSNQTFNLLDEPVKNILIEVIQNHHRPEIPIMDDGSTLFFSKLLRDADKLDIWRSTTEYLVNKKNRTNWARELGLSEKPVVTKSFYQTIIEGGVANKAEIVTLSDFLIYRMSWVFDLNFRKSYQILNQKQYIRHMYDTLPKNDDVIEIYRMIKIHIQNQIL